MHPESSYQLTQYYAMSLLQAPARGERRDGKIEKKSQTSEYMREIERSKQPVRMY
jgi:hypothetical protein